MFNGLKSRRANVFGSFFKKEQHHQHTFHRRVESRRANVFDSFFKKNNTINVHSTGELGPVGLMFLVLFLKRTTPSMCTIGLGGQGILYLVVISLIMGMNCVGL
jgi:hypothetical protein